MSKCKCMLAHSCGITILIHSFLPTAPFSEGYERLAWARNGGTAIAARSGNLDKSLEMNLLSGGTDTGLASGHNNAAAGTTEFDASSSQSQVLNGSAEEFDMFAEDDEKATINKSSKEVDHIPHGGNVVPQSSSSVDNAYPESKLNLHKLVELVEELLLCCVFTHTVFSANSAAGESQSDYVYDESSGYSLLPSIHVNGLFVYMCKKPSDMHMHMHWCL